MLLPLISFSQPPRPCTLRTASHDCLPPPAPLDEQCTFFYCDPNDEVCIYDRGALTGKPCDPTGNGLLEQSPYCLQMGGNQGPCHVDVCINGICEPCVEIDSNDPSSAGGLPPLTQTTKPWVVGVCSGGVYSEHNMPEYCGDGVCNNTETMSSCCTDCGCNAGYMCVADSCYNITSSTSIVNFSANWYSWVPTAVIALLFGYFLAALAYMASHIISSPQILAWSKNELYETSVSAWFVGSAIFFVGLLTTISQSLVGASYEVLAESYVQVLSAELMRIYGLMTKGVFAMGLLTSFWGTISLPILPLFIVTIGITGTVSPFGGMQLLSNTLMMFTNILSFAMFSVIGQKVVLDFILQVGFRILLPIAVVLRCFTFTRKMGATLMAIAIGAYIVYPITLVMNYNIYQSVAKIPQEEYHSSMFPLDDFNMGPWMDVFMGPNFGKWCKHWYDWLWFCWLFAIIEWIINFVKAIFNAFAFMFKVLSAVMRHGVGPVTGEAFEYYAQMIPWAMQPVTAAFLFPILDIIILLTAIRSLSEAIGGESRITGLAQFI